MNKQLPNIKTDDELADFMEGDLTEYLQPEKFYPTQFTFTASLEDLPKTENVHVRFSKQLLEAVKAKAASKGISYQKYIRRILETSLAEA